MLNLDHLDFGSQEYKSFQINKRLQIFIYMLILLFPFFSSFSPLFPLSFFSFSSPFFLGGKGARGPPGREARGTCPMCPMVNPSLIDPVCAGETYLPTSPSASTKTQCLHRHLPWGPARTTLFSSPSGSLGQILWNFFSQFSSPGLFGDT